MQEQTAAVVNLVFCKKSLKGTRRKRVKLKSDARENILADNTWHEILNSTAFLKTLTISDS